MPLSVSGFSYLLITLFSAVITRRALLLHFDGIRDYKPSEPNGDTATAFHSYVHVLSFINGIKTTDLAPIAYRRNLKETFLDSAAGKLNIVKGLFGKNLRQNTGSDRGNQAATTGTPISKPEKKMRNRVEISAMTNNIENLFVSPANGTEIFTHPIAVIKCANQTLCIQPKLQLEKKFDVYYCKHVGHGVRFYFLVKEGLLLHPNIRMIEDMDKADAIVYLPVSAPWHKSECNDHKLKTKTIVLDEGDGPQLFEPEGTEEYKKLDWLLYFKRSYVQRHNGVFKGYMNYLSHPNVLPMTYTVVEAYVKTAFNMMRDRDLEIVCTLRGSNSDPTRLRVRQWVQEYAVARGVKKYVAGQVNHASRTEVSTDYLTQMFRAKIIVTSNPSDWEGDFRLMEAMASGALIFVDQMFVPRPYALKEGTHIVFYDNNNKTDIFEKLDFYRKNLEVARRVAVSGYLHAMKYHRAANLIDYVFRTVHLKTSLAQHTQETESGSRTLSPLPQYSDTGYDMRLEAVEFKRKKYAPNARPGAIV